MIINRELYLEKLKERMHNGMIKVITGVRRCGKSFLLFNIFYRYLLSKGVDSGHVIMLQLDDRMNKSLRDPDALLSYINAHIIDENMHYVLLDEVQMVDEFEDVLNSLLHKSNLDVYVTGSNAKFLSKDVITEFRGRGDEIRLYPLNFSEYLSVYDGTREQALLDYMNYGGLPQLVTMKSDTAKEEYLKSLFLHTYLTDIKERYTIRDDSDLEEIIDFIASSIGTLVNPSRIINTFKSVKHISISFDKVKRYLDMLEDAFLIERSIRYDIKGRRYIDTPSKYYFVDLGIRNARLDFRQMEKTHLMENLIYNELRLRGFSVDVGEVTINTKNDEGKSNRKLLEVDFVCNHGYKRYYIQSAYALPTADKIEQEIKSLVNINDGFQKMVITAGDTITYRDDNGILYVNIFDFLLDNTIMNI